jgi:uncharacterized protein YkwD
MHRIPCRRNPTRLRSRLRTLVAASAGLCVGGVSQGEERPDLDAAARRIVAQTNEFRGAERLEATRPDDRLRDAARALADHMARSDRYGHDADGRSPAERVRARGYDHCIVSENIAFVMNAAGFRTDALASGFVEGWKHSPGHRRNMQMPEVVDTGVAIARSPHSLRYYAVQLFGRPRSALLRFSVVNPTERPLAYALGEQRFDLPPRATRIHEQCRADPLTIGTGRDALRVEPVNGARYRLEATAHGAVGLRRD